MLKLKMDGAINMDILSEKKIMIKIIGVLEAIKNNSMSITEGEKYLFSPRIVKRLIDDNCDERIINIIEECCELEDISSLIPNKLIVNIDLLKERTLELLKSYETVEMINWN